MTRYVRVLVEEFRAHEVCEDPLREWTIGLILLEAGFRQHKLISGDA